MSRGGNVARADRFLILFSAVSFVAATTTSLPNVWHVSSGGLSVTQLAITILQWLVIITSALCVSMLICRANAVAGKLFGAIVLVALPIIVVIDPIVLAWADQRFLSAFTVRVIPRLGQLIPHASEGTWRLIGAKTLMIVAILVAFAWSHRRLLARWNVARERSDLKATAPWRSAIRLFAFCLVALVLVMLVSKHSSGRPASRHSPFYVLRIASQARPPARKSLISGASLSAQGTAPVEVRAMPIDLDAAILRRDQQQRQIGFDLSTQDFDPAQSPDIVIVVLESLRPELFAADVMPNTDAIGKRGIRCENHYSGGNSTNLGMFSLVNGLEAMWWKRPVRYSPIMNRVFRSAGYRTGFFGGHDDWRAFYMDGFISDQQYDVFEIEPRDWLASDERAVANAEQFFSERGASPKLAVVYLYSTHADYRSEPRDQINQPAAPDGFTIPFADEDRQAVWNRYRNAARTADSFIGRLDASDRIIVVIGDHGESFLEDGTCGHGTKLSKVQNATPAVIAYPGSTPKTIHHATSHIDILPTLIELTSLPVIGLNSLDGVSLASKQDQQLANRCFATLDHLTDRIAIPLRHANVAENQQTPWAVSGEVNLRDKIRCLPISTLDQKGGSISLTKAPELFSQWANKRFR